jgi:hypothetical protein
VWDHDLGRVVMQKQGLRSESREALLRKGKIYLQVMYGDFLNK